MEKKITNDQNIENLKKRKILRLIIIFFSLLTIILALANLFFNLNILFAFSTFIITAILNKMRDKTKIIKKDELKDVRKALNKNRRTKK